MGRSERNGENGAGVVSENRITVRLELRKRSRQIASGVRNSNLIPIQVTTAATPRHLTAGDRANTRCRRRRHIHPDRHPMSAAVAPIAERPTPSAPRLAAVPTPTDDPKAAALRIAAFSALILFFELAFIRYSSAYVRVFGFYQNFVLIATFLGMGVGLMRARSADTLKWVGVPTLVGLLGAIYYFNHAAIAVPTSPDEYVWGIFAHREGAKQIPLLPVVAILFALCALFFLPLGASLGAQFRKLPGLQAYSFDIIGSLVGIAVFGVLSATRQPPMVWFALGIAAWCVVAIDDKRFVTALAVAGAAALAIVGKTKGTGSEYWSPYYRINVQAREALPRGFQVDVNGSLHQFMIDLSPASLRTDRYALVAASGYERPYRFAKRVDTALVVGAGTGNDLAVLLGLGAKHIDAVEIDPVIAGIGQMGHPQAPYADPRVHLHVNDARAYLRRAERKYDVIVFGTLDSQTLLSGMSSVRLDNYVYTVESFRSARERLKPDGTLIAYHMSGFPYIAAKIYQMLGEAFGSPPGVFSDFHYLFNYTFIAGAGASAIPAPTAEVAQLLTQPVSRPHDDWPYLYLKGRVIPAHYVVALGAMFLITAVFVGIGGGRTLAGGVDLAMFLMGAGFLLVETKSVTEMSLLFGSTWTVNLMVFTSILVMVLLANLAIQRLPRLSTTPLFGALLASLAVAYMVPVSDLLWLGTLGQWVVGGLLVAMPVLFASLIFSTLLAARVDPARALAYNLLGAIVGGALEYSSMAIGIKGLYLLAAGVYAAALLVALRSRRMAAA
jgi:spermidine synthase